MYKAWHIFTLLFALSLGHAKAQETSSQWLEFKDLDYQSHLPKYLRARKSAVFVSVPRRQDQPNLREDWKKLSHEVHQAFVKMRIDAVAYYYLEDVLANPEVNLIVSDEMRQRAIKYMILVSQTRAADSSAYQITITAFNKKKSYISEKQKAWQMQGKDLQKLLTDMRKKVYQAEMDMENYLILDVPAFFTDVKIIKGRRFPVYAKDLKVDRLAVPRFQKYIVEDSTVLAEETRQNIATYNLAIAQKNKRLEEMMSSYPLKYGFVNTTLGEALYRQGYQFVLMLFCASITTVQQALAFDTHKNDRHPTASQTVVIPQLPPQTVVYKYYVKQVYAKDVYVGSTWDAAVSWEAALQQFIAHTKASLNLKE